MRRPCGKKCRCITCLVTPGTWINGQLEKSRKQWRKRTEHLIEQVRRSQRLTAADMSLRINT